MSLRPAIGILAGAFLLAAAVPGNQSLALPNPDDSIGDEACRGCHAKQVESYFATAHHLTSRPPAEASIRGSFAQGRSILRTSNPSLHFRMEAKADGFYQTALWSFTSTAFSRTERIDVVVGSGRVGQTYLYWNHDRLFQLPVSYWSDLDSWVNSPGYRDGTANFERPVHPRCLECHLTYAEPVEPASAPNRYKPESLVYGISCEHCHGPGRGHAEAMKQKSSSPKLVSLKKLARDRQMDVCAQCHGGRRFPVAAAFSYLPGEPLDYFYRRDQANPTAPADVHGNQIALLQMSRCYQASSDLVCTTCHDVHQVQRDADSFSDRCLKCHRAEVCGEYPRLKQEILTGCVGCHMPVQPSKLIITSSNGKQTRAMVRSHWIKIYADSHTP